MNPNYFDEPLIFSFLPGGWSFICFIKNWWLLGGSDIWLPEAELYWNNFDLVTFILCHHPFKISLCTPPLLYDKMNYVAHKWWKQVSEVLPPLWQFQRFTKKRFFLVEDRDRLAESPDPSNLIQNLWDELEDRVGAGVYHIGISAWPRWCTCSCIKANPCSSPTGLETYSHMGTYFVCS